VTQTFETSIKVEDGILVGPLREPRNPDQSSNSIHNDEIARKVGFRGGTVAGSIHMDLSPPLMLEAFGDRWYERGTLSLLFLNATMDREPVRAYGKQPPADAADTQVDVWINRDDGMEVAKGTASAGNSTETTALLSRPLDRYASDKLRILANVKAGDTMGETGVIYSQKQQEERLKLTSDVIDYYRESPWGNGVVTPAGVVHLLYQAPVAALQPAIGPIVGLFGAIETRQINGPVMVETPYVATGKVLATGESPKTEYFWFESALDDQQGKRVAEMLMLLRFMKASSPLYES
jgi:hypothetical protein